MEGGQAASSRAFCGREAPAVMRRHLSLQAWLLAGAITLVTAAADAQTTPRRYVAFGDSITQGVGDNPSRAEQGYPPRLEDLLNQRGVSAQVDNRGLAGETTGAGVSRINRVLNDGGGDVLLLMEGTIVFNLNEIAERAEARGMQVVHATVIPRNGSNYDANNRVTADLNGKIREMAYNNSRELADPFEVILYQTANPFTTLYVGGADKLHPNAAGYDVIARIFADVLTNVDTVPPVTGQISPRFDEPRVAPTAPILIDLYDFGRGIDLTSTRLLINGTAVETPLQGNSEKLEIRYAPTAPFSGRVTVGLESRDLATPPNLVSRTITEFTVGDGVPLAGDVDRNGRIDGADLVALAFSFGATRNDIRYRAAADFNNDGRVDGIDLSTLAANFGRTTL
jgi:lysophospholipase L1-like esterase